MVNETKMVSFDHKPRGGELSTQVGQGHLNVQLRLAYGKDDLLLDTRSLPHVAHWPNSPTDSSYEYFYQDQDFPVVKYLREPLYFEVALESSDLKLALVLDNCWATLHKDRASTPSWDIIVDGLSIYQHLYKAFLPKNEFLLKLSPSCENKDDIYSTTFLPVVSDARVAIPSHYKHFSVQMFTFIMDEKVSKDQVRTRDAPSVQDLSWFQTLSRYMSTVMLWFVTLTKWRDLAKDNVPIPKIQLATLLQG